MRKLSLTVDPARSLGTMRKILGINNSPRIKSANEQEVTLFKELNPAYVRYHDAVAENYGFALIDVSRIFPLFHLDENDPRNYIFKPTDDYLSLIADSGVTIDFRLGETIEHSREKYRVYAPTDPDKWARICLNILRHYLCGWANGFHWTAIKYVSVWEEPDNTALFYDNYDDYPPLFVKTYRLIKAEFPFLKIGGPNAITTNPDSFKKFFSYCRENNVVPDFVSTTIYSQQPDDVVRRMKELSDMTRRFGWSETEIMLVEWHLGPASWGDWSRADFDPRFLSVFSAAFSVSTLMRLLTQTDVTAAYFYAWAVGRWGVFSTLRPPEFEVLPVYYGLKYFSEFSQCSNLVAVTGAENDWNTDAAAAVSGDRLTLLVSVFKEDSVSLTVSVPGYKAGRYKTVSNEDGMQSEMWHELAATADGRFAISAGDKGMHVLLMTFDRA